MLSAQILFYYSRFVDLFLFQNLLEIHVWELNKHSGPRTRPNSTNQILLSTLAKPGEAAVLSV